MWHFLFLVLALSFVANPALAENAEDECESYPDIPVHIIPRFDAPVYDYSKGIAEITGMSADAHRSIRESLTLGLTRYEPMLRLEAPIKGVQFPDGLFCAHVDHVDVTVGYQDVTVYIANEIPAGSCGFDQVMAHEQRHINANMQILEEYKPLIATELADYLKTNGAFREADPDYSIGLLREKMHEIIASIMEKMTAENTERQREIDTPDEYARIGASCNGQLRDIARQAVRQGQR